MQCRCHQLPPSKGALVTHWGGAGSVSKTSQSLRASYAQAQTCCSELRPGRDGPEGIGMSGSAYSRWGPKANLPESPIYLEEECLSACRQNSLSPLQHRYGEHEHCSKAGCECCAQCTGAYPTPPVLQGCCAATRPAPAVVPAPVAAYRRACHGYADHRHAAAVRSGQGVWGWRQRGVCGGW